MQQSSFQRTGLAQVDHIALQVEDIASAVRWYANRFRCEVVYQDDTWALLQFANIRLTMVVAHQHPPHIGFTNEHAHTFGPLSTHRDGTRSIYLKDPAGNTVEVVAAQSLRHEGSSYEMQATSETGSGSLKAGT